MRPADRDVIRNDTNKGRVFVIVLEDAFMPIGDATMMAQHVARDVIHLLVDDDWAAVTFTGFGRRQDMTQDQQLLRAAVDSLTPSGRVGCEFRGQYHSVIACVIDTLMTAAQALSNAPQGRKTLVFISPGSLSFVREDRVPGQSVGAGNTDVALHDMLAALQRANVTVYSIDPTGINAPDARIRETLVDRLANMDGLHLLAEGTGGRTTASTNAPWQAVPQIFRENSSYYLLGFRSTNQKADGRFRKIRVVVDRPDVEVRTRSGYEAPSSFVVEKASPVASPIDAAIASSMPGGSLPLQITLAPFAIPRQHRAAVAVVTAIPEPPDREGQTLEVTARALDADCGDCRKLLPSTHTATMGVKAKDRGMSYPEVISRLDLPPGRYEIRVAALVDGRTGNVFAHLEIPRYDRERLSASGLVMVAQQPRVTVGLDTMADLLPVVPTTAREFVPGDSASTFMRLYQDSHSEPTDVRVRATILDASGTENFEATTLISAATFKPARFADYRLELPLRRLLRGRHLLTVQASRNDVTIVRQTQFQIR
jgi:VWFA-related protein